jgi:hypothetical protein
MEEEGTKEKPRTQVQKHGSRTEYRGFCQLSLLSLPSRKKAYHVNLLVWEAM